MILFLYGSKSAVPLTSSARQVYLSKRTRQAGVGASGSGHKRSYENVLGHLVAHRGRSGPFQARKDRPSHHPVLVALRQEAQLFGEMGDALAVACLGERVRDVGPPMAALRTEGVEQALQVHCHVAERIRFERIADRTRKLDADVRILGERNGLINCRRDTLGDPVETAR